MPGNILNKNKLKLFNTANSDLAGRISILENNVYKVTYYEIISGASGTLTVPTAATINSNEFSGANCILSEIDVNNKPTWVSPKTAGGTVVTATLNTGTGAWVKSGVTVSANVALIYSLNIRAADYFNLTNFYIIDEVVIGDFSYVLNNTTNNSVLSSLLASVMSDETGSGSLVFGTSPTFTTDITTPLIIGGSAVGSTIQYKGTTANGTSTVAAHQFLVGNNGATTAAQIFNSGQVSIGNYASPTAQRLVTIGQDTAWMSFGSLVGTTSQPAIYLNQATPSPTNYTITSDGSNVYLNTQSTTGFCYITTGNNTRFYFGRSRMSSNFAADVSGATTTFSFIIPAHTGQNASTEISNFKVYGESKTWANGGAATTITNQRWNYFTANTAATSGGGSLIITNSYGFYAEAATAGTNATITNNYALGGNGSFKFTDGTRSLAYTLAAANTLIATGDSSSKMSVVSGTRVMSMINFAADVNYLGSTGATLIVQTSDSNILKFQTNNTDRFTIGAAGSFTIADANNFIFNATTGTKLGTATTQKLAFWNATPIVQPSGAAQAALAPYATGAFGLDSNANMQAMYDLVMAMRTVLVNTGLMKGAA